MQLYPALLSPEALHTCRDHRRCRTDARVLRDAPQIRAPGFVPAQGRGEPGRARIQGLGRVRDVQGVHRRRDGKLRPARGEGALRPSREQEGNDARVLTELACCPSAVPLSDAPPRQAGCAERTTLVPGRPCPRASLVACLARRCSPSSPPPAARRPSPPPAALPASAAPPAPTTEKLTADAPRA